MSQDVLFTEQLSILETMLYWYAHIVYMYICGRKVFLISQLHNSEKLLAKTSYECSVATFPHVSGAYMESKSVFEPEQADHLRR